MVNNLGEKFSRGEVLDQRVLKKIIFDLRNHKVKTEIYNFLLSEASVDFQQLIMFLNKTRIFNSILNKKKLNLFETLYKIQVIGAFQLKDYSEFLLEQCKSPIVYFQNAAIQAVVQFKQVPLLLEAVKIISQDGSDINNKILIESLLSFNGNHEMLQDEIIHHFDSYPYRMKLVVLNYCKSVHTLQIQNLFYQLFLSHQDDTEILIVCLKYFMKVTDSRVKENLIALLKDERWEVRSFSVVALKNYQEETLKTYFEEMIKDKEWLVRRKSAIALYEISHQKTEISKIINSPDAYASDSMISLLSEKGVLEEYIDFISNLEKKVNVLKTLEKRSV